MAVPLREKRQSYFLRPGTAFLRFLKAQPPPKQADRVGLTPLSMRKQPGFRLSADKSGLPTLSQAIISPVKRKVPIIIRIPGRKFFLPSCLKQSRFSGKYVSFFRGSIISP